MHGDLIDALDDRLTELGLQTRAFRPLAEGEEKVLATLRRGRQSGDYLALLSPHMSLPDFASERWSGYPLLVLGARITPRNADRMREVGINYLDANGNAFITFGDVLVDVRGRTGDPVATFHRERVVTSNLFSPKRAQVAFALISWPHLVTAKLREIAEAARVSVGFAQKTLADFEAANYVQHLDRGRAGRRLTDVAGLIDGWTAAFPGGLGSPEGTRAFRGTFDPDALAVDGPVVYLSGEPAAPLIRHHATWTLYCDEVPREAAAAGRWTARSSEPNVFLRDVFWKSPSESSGGRLLMAPPLLVYADLMASGDSRQREAANALRGENAELREG